MRRKHNWLVMLCLLFVPFCLYGKHNYRLRFQVWDMTSCSVQLHWFSKERFKREIISRVPNDRLFCQPLFWLHLNVSYRVSLMHLPFEMISLIIHIQIIMLQMWCLAYACFVSVCCLSNDCTITRYCLLPMYVQLCFQPPAFQLQLTSGTLLLYLFHFCW